MKLLDCTFNDVRKTYLRNWLENAFFQLVCTITGEQYKRHLEGLLNEFARCLCEEGIPSAEFELDERGGEGSALVIVNKNQMFGCKLYWQDDVTLCESLGNRPYMGLIFTDHYSASGIAIPECTHQVYIIADAFERFLRERNVVFARYNMLYNNELVLQTEPCPYVGEE